MRPREIKALAVANAYVAVAALHWATFYLKVNLEKPESDSIHVTQLFHPRAGVRPRPLLRRFSIVSAPATGARYANWLSIVAVIIDSMCILS